jgi:hypothetical protein
MSATTAALGRDTSQKGSEVRRPYQRRGLNRPEGWLDGRTREAKFLGRYQAMLLQHLGGSPSALEVVLIRRAARIALQLELLDSEVALRRPDKRRLREYAALNSGLIRILRSLGVADPPPDLDLASYLARKARSDKSA